MTVRITSASVSVRALVDASVSAGSNAGMTSEVLIDRAATSASDSFLDAISYPSRYYHRPI